MSAPTADTIGVRVSMTIAPDHDQFRLIDEVPNAKEAVLQRDRHGVSVRVSADVPFQYVYVYDRAHGTLIAWLQSQGIAISGDSVMFDLARLTAGRVPGTEQP